MTVLLDFAIREFVASYGKPGPLVEDPSREKVEQETWEEFCEYRELLDDLEYQNCLNELEKIKASEDLNENQNQV